MAMLTTCFTCCTTASNDDIHETKPLIAHNPKSYISEKTSFYPPDSRTQTINDIFAALVATKPSSISSQATAKAKIDSLIHAAGGWQEWIAEGVLAKFIEVVEAGYDLLPDNFKDAFQKAKVGAEKVAQAVVQFAEEHPVYTAIICTVIAIGMLYLLYPAILEVLGFETLGPRLGSWAARWQSLYGDVPKKSLFSYLQRLGMKIGAGV